MRLAPALEPRPDRRPVARVIEQRAAAAAPRRKTSSAAFSSAVGVRLHLVRADEKAARDFRRSDENSVSVTDQPFVEQPLRRDVARGTSAVGQLMASSFPVARCAAVIAVRLCERRGERLLHHDM